MSGNERRQCHRCLFPDTIIPGLVANPTANFTTPSACYAQLVPFPAAADVTLPLLKAICLAGATNWQPGVIRSL